VTGAAERAHRLALAETEDSLSLGTLLDGDALDDVAIAAWANARHSAATGA
jgi:hypothetical protein